MWATAISHTDTYSSKFLALKIYFISPTKAERADSVKPTVIVYISVKLISN